MKPAVLAALMCGFFWATTLYLVPDSSDFSLNNVTATLGKSAQIATESLDGFLLPAQANSYDGPIEPKKTAPLPPSHAAKQKAARKSHRAPQSPHSSDH